MSVRLITSLSLCWGAATDKSTVNCPGLPVLRSGISRGAPMGSRGKASLASICSWNYKIYIIVDKTNIIRLTIQMRL